MSEKVDMDNPIDIANKMFKQSLVDAVGTVAYLAEHSSNEKVRLEAAKVVIERNLGKVISAGNPDSAWETIIQDITVRAGDKEYRRVQKDWKESS